jgi:hypothetical protein
MLRVLYMNKKMSRIKIELRAFVSLHNDVSKKDHSKVMSYSLVYLLNGLCNILVRHSFDRLVSV